MRRNNKVRNIRRNLLIAPTKIPGIIIVRGLLEGVGIQYDPLITLPLTPDGDEELEGGEIYCSIPSNTFINDTSAPK